MPRSYTTQRAPPRASGYHYERRQDGTKYRVYDNVSRSRGSARARTQAAPAKTKSSSGGGLNFGLNWRGQQRGRATRSRGLNVSANWRANRTSRGVSTKGAGGTVTVRHREFISTIESSDEFRIKTFELNPGLDSTFPWLSSLSSQFQQYTVKSMQWQFVSTSATSLVSGTNTALGQIAIGTQYDAVATPFANLNEMLNSEDATSTKISSNLTHNIETDRPEKTINLQYVRSGDVPDGADIRLYDLGKTSVATYGSQGVNQIGQLYVDYTIEFQKPISLRQNGGLAESAFYTCTKPEEKDWFNDTLGTVQEKEFDSIGLEFLVADENPRLIFPTGSSGYYQIQLSYFPSAIAEKVVGNLFIQGAVLQDNLYDKGRATYAGRNQPESQRNWNISFFVYIPDPSRQAVIGFDDWIVTGMRTADVMNLMVSQMHSSCEQFVKSEPTPEDIQLLSLQEQVAQLTLLVQGLQDEDVEIKQDIDEIKIVDADQDVEIQFGADQQISANLAIDAVSILAGLNEAAIDQNAAEFRANDNVLAADVAINRDNHPQDPPVTPLPNP